MIQIWWKHIFLLWKIIWSGHNFAHVTTAELSWHVQFCDLTGPLESKLEQKLFSQNFNYQLINDLWNGFQKTFMSHPYPLLYYTRHPSGERPEGYLESNSSGFSSGLLSWSDTASELCTSNNGASGNKTCQHICYVQHIQSGTKPNLVAKIWPPNLVTICALLPKLVANVSSNFHRLVNTGLAIGSFFKWLPITVAHTCKLDTIWVVYISPIGNGSIRL